MYLMVYIKPVRTVLFLSQCLHGVMISKHILVNYGAVYDAKIDSCYYVVVGGEIKTRK